MLAAASPVPGGRVTTGWRSWGESVAENGHAGSRRSSPRPPHAPAPHRRHLRARHRGHPRRGVVAAEDDGRLTEVVFGLPVVAPRHGATGSGRRSSTPPGTPSTAAGRGRRRPPAPRPLGEVGAGTTSRRRRHPRRRRADRRALGRRHRSRDRASRRAARRDRPPGRSRGRSPRDHVTDRPPAALTVAARPEAPAHHQPVETTLDQCIKCNICVTVCPVAAVTDLFPGPKYEAPRRAARFRARTDPSPAPDASVDYCRGCRVCNMACPTGVQDRRDQRQGPGRMVEDGQDRRPAPAAQQPHRPARHDGEDRRPGGPAGQLGVRRTGSPGGSARRPCRSTGRRRSPRSPGSGSPRG